MTDQATNRYLKEIMLTAEIPKHISFHCARHTFATIGIEIGMRLDIISKILGHTDLKTTQIYSKYSIAVKRKEMEKWRNGIISTNNSKVFNASYQKKLVTFCYFDKLLVFLLKRSIFA